MGERITGFPKESLTDLCTEFQKNNKIEAEKYILYKVKRGLRNPDGSGVMAGLTLIGNVHGYVISNGEQVPMEGHLIYRGYDIQDLVKGFTSERRFGFEETVWLLLFGNLPTKTQLDSFCELLSTRRNLPDYFVEDNMIKNPSPDVMNQMARAVLSLYSYAEDPDGLDMENILKQSLELIAMIPAVMTYAYQVNRRHYAGKSMYLHPITHGLSTSETILRTIRKDKEYTQEEARLLDLCLMLHVEHGGGNNSTFAARLLSSSNTDTYASMSAAIGSLKGSRHGGANIKVKEMMKQIQDGVNDWDDDDEVMEFLAKIIRKEEGDGSGLIYGMGHAVYTLSDPRAVILKEAARDMAKQKGFGAEFKLIESVERLTPTVFEKEKGVHKTICANVDLYSGLVYQCLGIPEELYTPIFAVARMPGWCAHRIEEVVTGGRIIRPAYKAVMPNHDYVPINQRT